MPNSVTVVSPVSGETLYLPGTDAVIITVDYEHAETGSVYLCGNCTAGLPGGGALHFGTTTSITNTSGDGEVGLGDHSGTHTDVTLSGLLMSGQNIGTHFAQFSVNNITITETIPAIRFDLAFPLIPKERTPYFFRLPESAFTPERLKEYALDDKGVMRPYKPESDAPLRHRKYDPTKDLEVYVLIKDKDHRDNGKILVEVSAQKKKTDLQKVHSAISAITVTDEAAGQCKVVIPKKVFKNGGRKARQVVLTLLDKNEDFVATISSALKPK